MMRATAEEELRSEQMRQATMRRMIGTAVLLGTLSFVPAMARAEDPVRPYDEQLLRLTEILGAVHYLREICGANEGQVWRERMEGIVNAEGSTPLRRIKLVKSFNKGYRSYRRTYRSCNTSAELAATRFLTEGAELSDKLLKSAP